MYGDGRRSSPTRLTRLESKPNSENPRSAEGPLEMLGSHDPPTDLSNVTHPTLVDLLAERFARPTVDPYRFRESPEGPPSLVSWAELDRLCTALAADLQAQHEPGERVLVVLPAGKQFIVGFLGCVLAGMVPVPCPTPGSSRPGRAGAQ